MGVWWFGIKVATVREEQLRIEESTMREQIHQLREASRRAPGDAQRPARIDHALRLVNDALPTELEAPVLLAELRELVDRHGLILEQFLPAPMSREPAFSELPVHLKVHGSFEAFYGFLLTVESSPQVVRITGLEMRKVETAQVPMQVSVQLSLFFRPDE